MEDWLNSLPPNVTPYEACLSYTDTILECAEKTIPKKIICKHSKPFMNKHLKSLQNNIRKLRKVYHKRSDPNNWRKLQTAIKEYSNAYDQASSFINRLSVPILNMPTQSGPQSKRKILLKLIEFKGLPY